MEILHLFVSPGHNFRGHHGGPPGDHPVQEVPLVQCVADRGIEGDRYFAMGEGFKGQITFFAEEVYLDICEQLQVWNKPLSVFRRNVITRGVNLNSLVGREFEIQGIRFLGVEECAPCYWMDEAFGPGAQAALKGRGGLRARILSSGTLRAATDLMTLCERALSTA